MSIDNFPIIVCPPSWTDDDNDFHSDILYFRALLNDISELVYASKFANPFPITLSDELSQLGGMIQIAFAAATAELLRVTW